MAGKRTIIGLYEDITIFYGSNKEMTILARIDTGATKSSIDKKLAEKLKLGPITRTKVVKSAHGSTVRPMINVNVELAKIKLEEEFTLADRSHMKYKVLVGQNILKSAKVIIDPLK